MRIHPGIVGARVGLGNLLLRQRHLAEALRHYQAALGVEPDNAAVLNNVAWVLATAPDEALRDGAQAVRLAERACELTGNQQTACIGTLAAAYAEAGQFEKAVATARRACSRASSLGDTNLLQRNQELLQKCLAGKSHRERN